MFRNFKVVPQIVFGRGSFSQTKDIVSKLKKDEEDYIIFLVDDVFTHTEFIERIPLVYRDRIMLVSVKDEPKTSYVDSLTQKIKDNYPDRLPSAVVGIGGGATMDLAKAVSLMLTNEGSSSLYQGWDLIKNKAVYHIAIPTLSGTGAEVSRTTVLTGPTKKLGINSDYTVFDQIILDPELIKDAPKEQRFYTAMDCYIHCIESLQGTFLNAFSRAYGEKALDLCREIFLNDNVEEADDKLMMASYFGGMSIAYSQVGVCHAMSYGLSFVLGIHHGIGCCIAFNYLEDYYKEGVLEFKEMLKKNKIDLPKNITKDMKIDDLNKMADTALGLAPLWENALGKDWKEKINKEKVLALYKKM